MNGTAARRETSAQELRGRRRPFRPRPEAGRLLHPGVPSPPLGVFPVLQDVEQGIHGAGVVDPMPDRLAPDLWLSSPSFREMRQKARVAGRHPGYGARRLGLTPGSGLASADFTRAKAGSPISLEQLQALSNTSSRALLSGLRRARRAGLPRWRSKPRPARGDFMSSSLFRRSMISFAASECSMRGSTLAASLRSLTRPPKGNRPAAGPRPRR